MKRIIILAVVLILLLTSACNLNPISIKEDLAKNQDTGKGENSKVKIVASLFPQCDFAREVVGDRGETHLLLPPGIEAHSFEPTPRDIQTIREAQVFLYTGEYMEPWAEKILEGTGEDLIAVNLSQGIQLENKDPHIWLDPLYAERMVDRIIEAVSQAEPNNRDYYEKNGEAYKEKLRALDKKCFETFEKTKYRTIVCGGHFAFGYFAKRYGLDYLSPYLGFSPNAEPSPKKVTELIQNMETLGIDTIYYEELVDPKIARQISEETGARMLLLHGAHNISREEFESGLSYLDIMEENLEKLKEGLVYIE